MWTEEEEAARRGTGNWQGNNLKSEQEEEKDERMDMRNN